MRNGVVHGRGRAVSRSSQGSATARGASRVRRRLLVAVAAIAAIASLALVAGAFGASGDLTPLGCIDDEDSGAGTCATTGDGLDNARAVAVSPDGKSVYTISDGDNAIARFHRNVTTGALTYQDCFKDAFSSATCANTVPGGVLIDGVDIAVSPDGKAV